MIEGSVVAGPNIFIILSLFIYKNCACGNLVASVSSAYYQPARVFADFRDWSHK